MAPEDYMNEPEDEGQLFFITEKPGNNGRNLKVMSTSEIEDEPPSRMLVAGHFHTREQAETALQKGLADGTYLP